MAFVYFHYFRDWAQSFFPLSDTSPILSVKISALQAMLQCMVCCKKKVTVELNVEGAVHLQALLPGLPIELINEELKISSHSDE